MKKTCTVSCYLCNRIARTGCPSAIETSFFALGLHRTCTHKLDVELKFGVYERVGKVGVVDFSVYPILGTLDIRNHCVRCCSVLAGDLAET